MISLPKPKNSHDRHICIIWQRFLPYHVARIEHLKDRISKLGGQLTAIEVASQDLSYGFAVNFEQFGSICCFPNKIYHTLKAGEIHKKVFEILKNIKPDIVFAPAIAFPEGMASIVYRLKYNKRVVLMDDSWEHTDKRGALTRFVKKLIHRNLDAAFIPSDSHMPYYKKLGFPEDRIIFGADVVDNTYFSGASKRVRSMENILRSSKKLPQNYFLFVGRFLKRKGIDILLDAFQRYSAKSKENAWGLVLVGTGPYVDRVTRLLNNMSKVLLAGPQYGDDLCTFYGLASAMIVPSVSDQWGLVVNEAMASGLPVLVSTGCGSAQTLVRDGENGWAFSPEDAEHLSELMVRVSELSRSALDKMGNESRKIIADWSLDRFADGVLKATGLTRRSPAGSLSDLASCLWKGRVTIN